MANEGLQCSPLHRPMYTGIPDANVAMVHFQHATRNGFVPKPGPAAKPIRIHGEKYGPQAHVPLEPSFNLVN